MRVLMCAAVAALFLFSDAAKAGSLDDCMKQATDAVTRLLPDPRDIDRRLSPAYVEALLRHALASMSVGCAKKACKQDVRECKNVPRFENEQAQRFEEMNKIPRTR